MRLGSLAILLAVLGCAVAISNNQPTQSTLTPPSSRSLENAQAANQPPAAQPVTPQQQIVVAPAPAPTLNNQPPPPVVTPPLGSGNVELDKLVGLYRAEFEKARAELIASETTLNQTVKQKQEYMHYANAWDARAATYLQQMKETQNKLDTANLNIQDWHLRNVLQRAKAALGVEMVLDAEAEHERNFLDAAVSDLKDAVTVTERSKIFFSMVLDMLRQRVASANMTGLPIDSRMALLAAQEESLRLKIEAAQNISANATGEAAISAAGLEHRRLIGEHYVRVLNRLNLILGTVDKFIDAWTPAALVPTEIQNKTVSRVHVNVDVNVKVNLGPDGRPEILVNGMPTMNQTNTSVAAPGEPLPYPMPLPPIKSNITWGVIDDGEQNIAQFDVNPIPPSPPPQLEPLPPPPPLPQAELPPPPPPPHVQPVVVQVCAIPSSCCVHNEQVYLKGVVMPTIVPHVEMPACQRS